jgi:hypothetical protein
MVVRTDSQTQELLALEEPNYQVYGEVSMIASTDPIVHSNPEIQSILNKAQDVFINQKLADGGIYHDNKSYLTWKNKEGFNIVDSEAMSVSSIYLCKDNYQSPFEKIVSPVYSALEKLFTDNNFVKNESSTIGEYHEGDSTMGNFNEKAYQKGNIQCKIQGTPDCNGLPGGHGEKFGSSIGVSCTDSLTKNEQEQIPLLIGLDVKNDAISSYEQKGDYVIAHLTTTYIIAHKETDGSYKKIYQGQDGVSCELARDYQFPKDLIKVLKLNCNPTVN